MTAAAIIAELQKKTMSSEVKMQVWELAAMQAYVGLAVGALVGFDLITPSHPWLLAGLSLVCMLLPAIVQRTVKRRLAAKEP